MHCCKYLSAERGPQGLTHKQAKRELYCSSSPHLPLQAILQQAVAVLSPEVVAAISDDDRESRFLGRKRGN
ncbi:hypothetical protein J6590_075157 [Homalodisca vitripennis]|nr:hypothetical protein J6590_075157 [Homalodisca vitripennis]